MFFTFLKTVSYYAHTLLAHCSPFNTSRFPSAIFPAFSYVPTRAFPCFATPVAWNRTFRVSKGHIGQAAPNLKPGLPDSTPCFTKTHHLQIKERRFMLSSSWQTIKLKQISSAVLGQVAPTTTAGLRAIKLWRRWRAFHFHSRTYRSNGDKWDVTALVKQGYNLSKSNIICDPLWHPLSLSFFFFFGDIWIQWLCWSQVHLSE